MRRTGARSRQSVEPAAHRPRQRALDRTAATVREHERIAAGGATVAELPVSGDDQVPASGRASRSRATSDNYRPRSPSSEQGLPAPVESTEVSFGACRFVEQAHPFFELLLADPVRGSCVPPLRQCPTKSIERTALAKARRARASASGSLLRRRHRPPPRRRSRTARPSDTASHPVQLAACGRSTRIGAPDRRVLARRWRAPPRRVRSASFRR